MNTMMWTHTNVFYWLNLEHLPKPSYEHNDVAPYQRILFVKHLTAYRHKMCDHGSENVALYQWLILDKQ